MTAHISFKDDFARFALLDPELQGWLEQNSGLNRDRVLEINDSNLNCAREVARVFPLRLRWYKLSRWGTFNGTRRYMIACLKAEATHFAIECRLKEVKNKIQRQQRWAFEPIDPYLQTR